MNQIKSVPKCIQQTFSFCSGLSKKPSGINAYSFVADVDEGVAFEITSATCSPFDSSTKNNVYFLIKTIYIYESEYAYVSIA